MSGKNIPCKTIIFLTWFIFGDCQTWVFIASTDHRKIETWRRSALSRDSVKDLDFPNGSLQLHVYSFPVSQHCKNNRREKQRLC